MGSTGELLAPNVAASAHVPGSRTLQLSFPASHISGDVIFPISVSMIGKEALHILTLSGNPLSLVNYLVKNSLPRRFEPARPGNSCPHPKIWF